MNKNPVNLAIRFLLEIAMLIVLGYWGWHLAADWTRYIYAAGAPVIAAVLWGVFRIQNDPKPAPVEVPGAVRLLLELGLFGFASWALYHLGDVRLCLAMVTIVIIHYAVSYDRTWVMILNKPYLGFVK